MKHPRDVLLGAQAAARALPVSPAPSDTERAAEILQALPEQALGYFQA